MVYVENNIFQFYKYKVEFFNTMTDKKVVSYVDDPDGVSRMASKHSHIEDIKINKLTPSVEEYERLKEFNALVLDIKENYINDCGIYVKFGAVLNKDVALKSIYDKSIDKTKAYIIDTLKPAFKRLRVEKELSGITLNGKWFDSDEGGRSALTSAMGLINIQISAGKDPKEILNQKVIWKMKDNVHAECTNAELQEVSLLIGKMVADAFKTEAVIGIKLMGYDLDKLLSIKEVNELRIYASSLDNEIQLKDVFEEIYQEVANGRI